MQTTIGGGFSYDVMTRSKADGKVLGNIVGQRNKMPMEGLNDLANAYLKGGAGPANLYIGLWSGSLIPDGMETAATLLPSVTEFVAYTQPARLTLTLGPVTDGACSNSASLARFDINAAGVVNGAFVSTAPAKGATSGKLLSVVRFDNPRAVDATVYLEILSGFQFLSF